MTTPHCGHLSLATSANPQRGQVSAMQQTLLAPHYAARFAILAYRGPRGREESAARQQIRQLAQRFGEPRAVPGKRFAVDEMNASIAHGRHRRVCLEIS